MKRKAQSVLVLYNVPRDASMVGPHGFGAESDAGVMDQVEAVAASLDALGVPHRVQGVSRFAELPSALAAAREEIIFNLVEGFHPTASDANLFPAVAAAFGKSVTGCDARCLILSHDKWLAKSILRDAGLPVPRGLLIPPGGAIPARLPAAPWIVKPVASDASEGIDAASVISPGAGSSPALAKAVRRIHDDFGQSALVERFVGTRELNIALVELDGQVRALPVAEISFAAFGEGRPRIVDYSAKWLPETFEYQNTPRVIPADIPESVARKMRRYALGAWNCMGCRDYARIDFRVDERGRAFILEANPNPDITPEAGFASSIQAAGISYDEFVMGLVKNAAGRLERSRELATA